MITESMLDLEDTLQSGQCFRFSTDGNGKWTVLSGVDENVRRLDIRQEDIDKLRNDPYWSNFFDLGFDYEALKSRFSAISSRMAEACAYAPGIRILNQDPWEALCSFVVSQNNNIKRIKGIVDRMCRFYGKQNANGDFGFPSARTLANATEADLRNLGLGFRAPYIINTAKAVADGDVDISKLKTDDIEQCRKTLMKVKGIGPKVADCALLFGCHRLDCFPMDTWMKKVMASWFNGQDKSIFGPYCGVAQQYLFHYARTGENNDI